MMNSTVNFASHPSAAEMNSQAAVAEKPLPISQVLAKRSSKIHAQNSYVKSIV